MNYSHKQSEPIRKHRLIIFRMVYGVVALLVLIIPASFAADTSSSEQKTSPASSAEPVVAEQPSAPSSSSSTEETQDAETTKEAADTASAPGNVSLDFKDADILNVLRVLSLKSGTNIVAGPEVQGTVTIRLQDVPWEKAMEVVLRTYGYVFEREGNIIRVTTKENLATEEIVTQTFVLNYTTASEVETAIKDILTERGRVKSVPRANTVIVSDVTTNIYKISQVITALDQITPQVYIDALIVRTQLDNNENLGINWNPTATANGSARPITFPFNAPDTNGERNPLNIFRPFFPSTVFNPATDDPTLAQTAAVTPATISSPFTTGTLSFASFQATVSLLRAKTNTKIVSNPRIVVLNNQTAKVQVGSEIPIPTFERNETTGSFVISGFSYRDVGIVLKVTPHINQSREILVDLKPEVSSQGSNVSFGSGGFEAPSFNTTIAETQLLIRDGETIAIGGLKRDNEKITQNSVPGLSKIPLLGKLFRNSNVSSDADANQKLETLFFVTITIVDTQGQPTMTQQPKAPQSGVVQQSSSQPPVPAVGVQKAAV